jgi:hypothetical protein
MATTSFEQHLVGVVTHWDKIALRGKAIEEGCTIEDAKVFYRIHHAEFSSWGAEFLTEGDTFYFRPKTDRYGHAYAADIWVHSREDG